MLRRNKLILDFGDQNTTFVFEEWFEVTLNCKLIMERYSNRTKVVGGSTPNREIVPLLDKKTSEVVKHFLCSTLDFFFSHAHTNI